MISKYVSVFLVGILELWGAVPTGLAFKLNPVLVVVFSAIGASTGAYLVLIIGEPLRKWLLTFKKANLHNSNSKINGVWDKYGMPGLCLVSPLLLGAHIGTAIALTLGGNKIIIGIWMTISCFLWAAIFTSVGNMGISIFFKG